MKRMLGFTSLLTCLSCAGAQVSSHPPAGAGPTSADPADIDLTRHVNPLIGTGPSDSPNPVGGGSGGSTFPGPAVPFGMVQWSPDTPKGEPSGYAYKDSTITGFSVTHFSGAGCGNAGELPILPTLDPVAPVGEFSHEKEHAEAGYYDVTLASGIRVELTATQRTGVGRFSYPAGAATRALVVDASRTNTIRQTASDLHVDGKSGLSGFTTGGRFCGAANTYRLYFALEADQPFASITVKDGKAIATFAPAPVAGTVNVKLGISYVSVENARQNLTAESPGWDFDGTRARLRQAWNRRLNAIRVEAGSPADLTKLYTALYHSLVFPSVFSDVNGQYVGFDKQVHTLPAGKVKYANFSGWDIYRSQVQLLALLYPRETGDILESLVLDAEQCGALPKWSQNNDETDVMVGDPGALIVANAFVFGATGFDQKAALASMLRTGAGAGSGCNGHLSMPGLRSYLMNGYIAEDGGDYGVGSTTLEYTNRDFAVAQYARAVGDETSYRVLMGRAATWQGLLHASGSIQVRLKDGSWKLPLNGPGEGNNKAYVEGNTEQYVWMVPYDPRTLIDGLGGNQAVVPRLDRFFSRLNAGLSDPYFYMGNEPNFATPWLYDWAGAPWRTQDVVRRIVDESFQASPGGLPGNDDLGATSSWLVFSAIGLYPSVPGVAGFAVGSPLFAHTTLQLGDGARVVSVRAEGAPARYVQSMSVNGKPHASAWLPYAAIQSGGEIGFVLGSAPSKWGSAPADAPPSFGPGSFASLADARNEAGIASDADAGATSFDGGGASYSREALAAAGALPGKPFVFAGSSFPWPGEGALDNVIAVGQTVRLAPGQHGAKLAFLGAASAGPGQGQGLVTYADGTSAPFTLGFSDWTLGGGKDKPTYDNQIALRLPYRNTRVGRDRSECYVFQVTVPLDRTREIASIRLPAQVSHGKLHVFAVAVVP